MPLVLLSLIRNLLSASYFNFDLFYVSPRLVIFMQYLLFASSNTGPFILEKQKDSKLLYAENERTLCHISTHTQTKRRKMKKKTKKTRNVTVCNRCPRRSLVRHTFSLCSIFLWCFVKFASVVFEVLLRQDLTSDLTGTLTLGVRT